ncbi:hypothetical protein [Avibacterium paragallinarum]|uniref:PEGA domain-containing protein n=1 Tax=Avibacterium paragallinarum TaxID=728 RepID=A0A0F5F1Q2_AVIPA|nr:hypothetical protein [Avibacterium paragallinarum]KAA6209276.1 hypothetical protein F1968_04910 [Avibacterium paragallinarum]KKB02540.1 hypothetical protein Z012_00645 [Avibacterium paragallinarum]RZN73675.1 hypothetical protein EIG77_02600 [Avibacterium paragallinarum]SUU98834.1 Uncharacterised protein [Avibacterium paragallinarum]
MKTLLKVAFLSSALALTGRATIVSDSKYPVLIKSEPSGAEFTIKNAKGEIISRGTTPHTVILKAGDGYFKKAQYTITFRKGKSISTVDVTPKVDGWYIGNLLFGGLVGLLIVDPITGAMYKLPAEVTGTLSTQKERALNIIDINTLTAEQRAKLEQIHL